MSPQLIPRLANQTKAIFYDILKIPISVAKELRRTNKSPNDVLIFQQKKKEKGWNSEKSDEK